MGAGDAFLAPEERLQAGSRAQGASLALLNTTKNCKHIGRIKHGENHEVLIIYIYIDRYIDMDIDMHVVYFAGCLWLSDVWRCFLWFQPLLPEVSAELGDR